MPADLHALPKLRDSLTFLYVERAIIEQDALSIVALQGEARIPIPIAAMTVLLLGPGTTVTHAAVKAVADCGCTVVWCGEQAARFYACGMGETRSAANLLQQAKLCMDPELHMQVVYRMYERRFAGIRTDGMTLQQIRGLEGIRVREAYRSASKTTGVKWTRRDYKTESWDDADPINQALSYANTILYAICQAAILSLGYSTGLGFVHTGKLLSFVYDIADLYKATVTIPAAFEAVAQNQGDLSRQVRIACRRYMRSEKVLARLPEDIAWILDIPDDTEARSVAPTGELWDGMDAGTAGGRNHARKEASLGSHHDGEGDGTSTG